MKVRKRSAILISMVLLYSLLSSSTCAFASSKPVLKKGMRSEAVRTRQANLKKLGCTNVDATGCWGDIKLAAVKDFQKKYNSQASSIVATRTQAKLADLHRAMEKPKGAGLARSAEGNEERMRQEELKMLGYM